MRHSIAVLALVALAACTPKNVDTGMLAAGSSIKAVGNQFVAAEAVYQANCKPVKPAFAKFCTGFYAFTPRFQQAYNPAVDTWNSAVKANDASKAVGAQSAILQLSVELAAILGTSLAEVK